MSILSNKVPARWQTNCYYPSSKPIASYVNDFCACFEWFSNWWHANRPPPTYWLGAFFHTRAFLADVKLNFARAQQMCVENVTFDFIVMEEQE